MANLTIRLKDDQLSKIKKDAADKNMDVTTYILSCCGVNNENNLTIQDIIEKVNGVPVGDVFTISSLYDYQSWSEYSTSSKMSAGRIFYKSLLENKFNLQKIVEFVSKNRGKGAVYKRI